MNIGLNIKKTREFKNISQEKLSELSGIPRTSLGRYERNERKPNMSIISRIAKSLEVEDDVLLHGIDTSIYHKDDILNLYKKLNTNTSLKEFFEVDGFDPDYECFIHGISSNKDFYYKLSKYLNLTDEQFYNWILSLNIYQLELEDDFYYNCFPKSDIEIIIKNDILKNQQLEDLLYNGLSNENKDLLKLYINEKKVKRHKLKRNDKFNIDDLSLSTDILNDIDLLVDVFNSNGFNIKSNDNELFYIINSSNKTMAKLTKSELLDINKILTFWVDSFMLNVLTSFNLND